MMSKCNECYQKYLEAKSHLDLSFRYTVINFMPQERKTAFNSKEIRYWIVSHDMTLTLWLNKKLTYNKIGSFVDALRNLVIFVDGIMTSMRKPCVNHVKILKITHIITLYMCFLRNFTSYGWTEFDLLPCQLETHNFFRN